MQHVYHADPLSSQFGLYDIGSAKLPLRSHFLVNHARNVFALHKCYHEKRRLCYLEVRLNMDLNGGMGKCCEINLMDRMKAPQSHSKINTICVLDQGSDDRAADLA